MSFSFTKKSTGNDDFFNYNEWLEAEGSGGWASSTLSGAHSRRYHGLLVASLNPPVERQVLLSKLDETIIQGEQRYELGCNHYVNADAQPGLSYLDEFRKDVFPQWIYKIGDQIKLTKTVSAIHEENLVLVQYRLEGSGPVKLEFLPLVAGRDYHSLTHENGAIKPEADFRKGLFSFQPYDPETRFYIYSPKLTFSPSPVWYKNFFYKAEQDRGQDCIEDLFNPGKLTLSIKPNETVSILISIKDPSSKDAAHLFSLERQRRLELLKDLAVDEFSTDMILASDQFIVKASEKVKTVIAGYHWFSDWGRDTMISLPGLCLVSKRFDEAKRILLNFSNHLYEGIIPNRFLDHDNSPEYNTCDATLWFFVACYRYARESKDLNFITSEMLPVFKSIIEWHQKGTLFNIHVDHDGLLYSGQDWVQLTWMDAKVGDWVVTPRTGKAVEINALWFNCLMIFAEALHLGGQDDEGAKIRQDADELKERFNVQFWNEEGGYLYDVINGDFKDASFRPNQLFAISLPFPLLDSGRAARVFEQVKEKLFTPRGLRSLAPGSPGYQPFYYGDKVQRDGAYHQGTVWSWLMGPYIDSLIYLKGEQGIEEARTLIEDFKPHLSEAGIGTVSEIFDATEPYFPKGCIAQAWGVAEILRVYLQYKLYK